LNPLRLDFIGGEELKEPNRLICFDRTSLNLLTDSIVSERTFPIRLSRVPADDGVIRTLTRKFNRHGWMTKTMHMPYPYLNLDCQTNPLKKSLREDLRRARRKAEQRGRVELEFVEGKSRERVRRHLQDAFQIEASGWKGRNRTAILSRDSRREFFERLADSGLREGTLRLAFLNVGGESSAVQYAIESANEYWLLNIGYRDDFREFSPGNLLLEETIKASARKGLVRYNFLGKEEPWTRRWTSEVRDCVVLAAYRPNYFGVRAILSDALYLYQKRRIERAVREIRKEPTPPFSWQDRHALV